MLTGISCQEKKVTEINLLYPQEIVDLGTLVTEDLPYQIWGKDLMDRSNYENWVSSGRQDMKMRTRVKLDDILRR